jgi:hypothetical protein
MWTFRVVALLARDHARPIHACGGAFVLQALELFTLASSARTTRSTDRNAVSSRSHMIVAVSFTNTPPLASTSTPTSTTHAGECDDARTTTGTVLLVDLAGSEKYSTAEPLVTTSINKCLSSLLTALVTMRSPRGRPDFRSNKLMELLKVP